MHVTSPTSRHWHARAFSCLMPAYAYWLFRPGALTQGLRILGRVDLRVTREYGGTAPADEAHALRLPARAPVWVREVVMAIDGTDCVSARSLTPLRASQGVWSGMRRLNTRPLADMLYDDHDIVRSPFAWRRLTLGDPFYSAVRAHGNANHNGRALDDARAINGLFAPLGSFGPIGPHGPLLARRSVFWRRNQPLIVAECFLPAFWEAAQQRRC